MAETKRKMGKIGTKVLLDNDRVRIWDFELPPGEDSPVHRHDLDYVLVQLAGDRIAVVPEPDSGGEYNEYMEADVSVGNSMYIKRGGIEVARNVGSQTYREILIELKD
jgi:hypothetical protein